MGCSRMGWRRMGLCRTGWRWRKWRRMGWRRPEPWEWAHHRPQPGVRRSRSRPAPKGRRGWSRCHPRFSRMRSGRRDLRAMRRRMRGPERPAPRPPVRRLRVGGDDRRDDEDLRRSLRSVRRSLRSACRTGLPHWRSGPVCLGGRRGSSTLPAAALPVVHCLREGPQVAGRAPGGRVQLLSWAG